MTSSHSRALINGHQVSTLPCGARSASVRSAPPCLHIHTVAARSHERRVAKEQERIRSSRFSSRVINANARATASGCCGAGADAATTTGARVVSSTRTSWFKCVVPGVKKGTRSRPVPGSASVFLFAPVTPVSVRSASPWFGRETGILMVFLEWCCCVAGRVHVL